MAGEYITTTDRAWIKASTVDGYVCLEVHFIDRGTAPAKFVPMSLTTLTAQQAKFLINSLECAISDLASAGG